MASSRPALGTRNPSSNFARSVGGACSNTSVKSTERDPQGVAAAFGVDAEDVAVEVLGRLDVGDPERELLRDELARRDAVAHYGAG